ncbi:MAG TPA: hypothetical protein VFZ24_18480 [Longimicrobiales bacterium]
MRVRSLTSIAAAAFALATVAACDTPTGTDGAIGPTTPFLSRFTLDLPQDPVFLNPADAAADPNPWFPLVPGTSWTYEAETEDGVETTVDAVTGDTREVDGVEATVVRDEVYLEGELIELTFDWYAQDTDGNVWYMGEASCEWEPGDYQEGDEYEEGCGEAGDPAGSWEAGVDGAEAGIIMWANPLDHKGKAYRQEYYEGEAEDMAKVLHAGLTVSVPAGTFANCIETMDWTPLEPGSREHKFYCAGYGMVLEVQSQGGRIRNELVGYAGLPVEF